MNNTDSSVTLEADDAIIYKKYRQELQKNTDILNELEKNMSKEKSSRIHILGRLDMLAEIFIKKYNLQESNKYDIDENGIMKVVPV